MTNSPLRASTKLLILAFIIFIYGFGYKVGQVGGVKNLIFSSSTQTKQAYGGDFFLFWDVWSQLKDRYVDQTKLVPEQMYQGAIKGMVASLGDPYTFFLTEKENKDAKDDLGGKFEGIGAQLGQKNGVIVVVAPIKGSPAEKAGIRRGDIIYKVDGEKTLDWNIVKAVSKIRGPKGTEVKLTMIREGKELDFTITRGQIKVASVESKTRDGVAIVSLLKFGDETGYEWDKAIDTVVSDYRAGKIKSMILDLRDNPGGYLQGAVYIAGEFLPEKTLIVTQKSLKGEEERYEVKRKGRLLDIPLLVLINEGSASASEIVSGALLDHKRAKLLGMKSFGKGSVQEALDLEGGSGLHVTIAKWLLPGGEWIHEKGITPEILVKQNEPSKEELADSTKEAYDLQLESALATLRGLSLPSPTPTPLIQ